MQVKESPLLRLGKWQWSEQKRLQNSHSQEVFFSIVPVAQEFN
jgi:hypothetical protein